MRSPAFTVPAEGDPPNSPAFFLPASSLSASNAQSATSHFFPWREGGRLGKDDATGVFSVFSHRSVVTKKWQKERRPKFSRPPFREKHCGPGSRAPSAQVAVCLVVRLQKAGTAHYARRRARPARRPHRFEFRTADASDVPADCRRSSLPSTRLIRQTHAPRGRPRTVWYFLDSTRIRAST